MKVKSVADVYSSYLDDIEKLEKENKRLKEQMKEANEIILKLGNEIILKLGEWTYVIEGKPIKISRYLKKWGVK